jgi:hypothetical protein
MLEQCGQTFLGRREVRLAEGFDMDRGRGATEPEGERHGRRGEGNIQSSIMAEYDCCKTGLS